MVNTTDGRLAQRYVAAAAAAKSLQSCLILSDPMDCSLPGSPVPGVLQARTLEWVAISFSNVWKWKVKVKSLSCVRLLATPWTAAYQAPPSMDFPGKSTEVGCHCLLREICYESLKGNYLLRHNSAVTMLDVNISNPPEERTGQLVMSMCYVSNRRFWTVKLWCKGPIAKTSSVLKTEELDVLESAVKVKVTHLCLTLCDPNGL